MNKTTKRILLLKDKMGLNDHQLEINAGLKPAFLQAWKNGKNNSKGEIKEINPSVDSIIKLAKYFNVSTDYLLCLTDDHTPPKTSNKEEPNNFSLSAKLAQLLEDKDFVNFMKLYNALNSEYQKQVYAYILGVATTLGLDITNILEK